MSSSLEDIKRDFPLHWLVWNNEHQQLQEVLQTEKVSNDVYCDVNKNPIMLCVTQKQNQYGNWALYW